MRENKENRKMGRDMMRDMIINGIEWMVWEIEIWCESEIRYDEI